MQNLSDHDIDRLFKDAAEGHRPGFDPSDWKAMSQQLDNAESTKPSTGITSSGTIIGIVVTASLMIGWYASEYVRREVKKHPLQGSVANTVSATDSATSSSSDVLSNNVSHSKVGKETGVSKIDSGISMRPQTVSAAVNLQYDRSRRIQPTKSKANVRSQLSLNKPGTLRVVKLVAGSHKDFQSRSGDGDALTIVGNEAEFNSKDLAKVFVSSSDSMHRPESSRKSYKRNSFSSDHDEVDSLSMEHSVEPKVILGNDLQDESEESTAVVNDFYRFSIRALVSPDYSSDRFKQKDRSGLNYGIEIGYAFTENIIAQVGVVSSRKYYAADHLQYDVYESGTVKGDCRMWDLPVNLRYQFFPQKRYGVSITAGLSSYLMDREKYAFEVETGYGKQSYRMEVKNGNREWFKMVNLSIGFQKKITDRFALQVEPFVKIPLAGVGEGKVKLASFGSFFAVQYNLFRTQR